MINNVLFYNKMVYDVGTPRGMLDIGHHQEAIDRKCIFLVLNAVVLIEIQPMHFTVMHWVVSPVQSTNHLIMVHHA